VGVRQARLRNEYAAWYPTLACHVWIPAKTVARAVTRQLLDSGPLSAACPRWAMGARILDDRHFTFRGGVERADCHPRTRAGDQNGVRGREHGDAVNSQDDDDAGRGPDTTTPDV